ncbi:MULTISPECIES: nucleotidyl transferase AbiEii/AbiGii toxin family protein [Azotobacter]|uniref:Nucleotidyl transferase AbiEii/AbiGii toxin family protein n=1 Tax=Azotobacter chroococcum TaxID=353 RepID=A0AAP9YK32_9GAMM|nr:nucleotidyl transferase AbiEii/AbiGii toxin family protein [Azotobacter chroococcum]QQE91327.1 nucleotidyl transferase AbiEii/AbiGii toxin family protein [Azotobacter chroococcum]
MNIQHELIQMISRVARALGPELCEKMAFVGGVTTGLLLTDEFVREQVRSTDDVDLIVHVIGTVGFAALQEQLQEKGFRIDIPDPDEDLPICAMKLDGMRVDFMPDDEAVLSFTNRWYREALETAMPHVLPDGQPIRLVSPAYFLATKLEAWKGRGQNDALGSRDIEDVLTLVDGREELIEEAKAAPAALWDSIAEELTVLLDDRYFQMAVESQAQGDGPRRDRLYIRLEQLAKTRPC